MAEQGRLAPAQELLTLPTQPPEMLFNVKQDPFQLNNLAADPQHQEVLQKMRNLLAQWKDQTGDTVPTNPSPDRQPLHEGAGKGFQRGEFPGAARQATTINHPGPITLGG